MPTRRSHQKSRRGCVTCKSRHVKCDEGGPPCERCSIRGLACDYGSPNSSSQMLLPTDSRTEPAHSSAKSVELIFPAHRRLLELQLMHRWSTVTYKSCITPESDDDEVWQFKIPHLSLQHDFLLNGVFALSALEIARLTEKHDCGQYVNAAIEYHTLALSSFRSQLPVISSDSHEAVLCLSMILMIFALASAQFASKSTHDEHGGMVKTAITLYELLSGCGPIAQSKEGYIAENPYFQKIRRFEDLPRATLEARTEAAITKLGDLNDKRITQTVYESDERRVQQVAYWEACKKALALLRQCFEKCVDSTSQGYVLGWLNMAGSQYIKAIKEDDHIALLMLIYWGVLVERFRRQVWWTHQFGNLLVQEILDRDLGKDTDTITTDIILWAQEMIRETSSKPL